MEVFALRINNSSFCFEKFQNTVSFQKFKFCQQLFTTEIGHQSIYRIELLAGVFERLEDR